MAKEKNDLMSSDNEVRSPIIKWGKVNDYFIGALREVGTVTQEKDDGSKVPQKVYFFKIYEGSYHDLINKQPAPEPTIPEEGDEYRVYGKAAIDAQMRNIKLGQVVAMKFIEEKPAASKMRSNTKVIKVYTKGDMDEEITKTLADEMAEDNGEAAADEAMKNF